MHAWGVGSDCDVVNFRVVKSQSIVVGDFTCTRAATPEESCGGLRYSNTSWLC